jgi:signal transduction histidine kinase
MLRNLKVGTKLFVILLAPMLVIVALVAVGVRDRRADAADATRVEDLSSFALVGADLVSQLQVEQIRSAMFSASRGNNGRTDLDSQRARTDAAINRYQTALEKLDPGPESGSLSANLELARTRLNSIRGLRGQVDSSLSQPYTVTELYGDAISSFVGVNSSLTGEANDPDLLRGLDAMARVEQLREAQSAQAALIVAASQSGGFTDRSGSICPDVRNDCESYDRAVAAGQSYARSQDNLSRSGATPAQKQAVANAQGVLAYQDMASQVMAQGVDGNGVTVPVPTAFKAAADGLQGLTDVDNSLTQQVVDTARSQEQAASRSVMLYLLAGAVGLAIAFGIAVVVARSITGPLSRLTKAAGKLSGEQLPALVQQLRSPEDEENEAIAETLTPIEVDSHDEIGDLAAAFNSIQAVTVDVAEEQGRLLRKGIGDIFVNLARRNQSLLDRQIEFIDHLESNERDPDQLDNLFKLDHLATRMRRNAESLLVMAGADPPRRRGAPVPVSDVVRVAIGEVEDYQRVHLLALDEATVAANVAADLAHLLSELMENATNASPPNTSVEVLGRYDARNGYVVTVADRGIGMSEDQLADANHHLAHPPMVGLVISRSLGLTVVGRLAARYGLSVRLAPRDDGGIVATVALPYGLVEYPDEESVPAPSALEVMAAVGGRPTRGRRPSKAPVPVPAAAAPAEPGSMQPMIPVPSGPPTSAGLPRRGGSPSAVPTEAPASSPAMPSAPSAPAAPPAVAPVARVAPAGAPGLPSRVPSAPAPAAAPTPPPAADVAPSVTAAGLVRRTPVNQRPDAEPAGPARAAVTRTNRSPDEVRRMLSRYRSGLDRGRTGGPDGDTPDPRPSDPDPHLSDPDPRPNGAEE